MTRWAAISAMVNADRASPSCLYWIVVLLLEEEFLSRASTDEERVWIVCEPWSVQCMRVDRSLLVEINFGEGEEGGGEEEEDVMVKIVLEEDLLLV